MKNSIEFEEKINWYTSLCFQGKSLLITLHLGEISRRKSSAINEQCQWIHTVTKIYKNTYNMNYTCADDQLTNSRCLDVLFAI